MVVQHNMTALNANRNLGVTCGNLAKSTEKLSSGYKINRAGDNAAGLAISEKMRGQIRGLNRASDNAEDGISMIQTAEGALSETHSIIQRMRELAVQSASDTNTEDDRTQIQNEINQLTEEVDRIANTTEFNTKKLINGDRKGAVNQKEGTGKVEGTFANSLVSIDLSQEGTATDPITGNTMTVADQLKLAKETDVIRIEFLTDGGVDPESGKGYKITSLFNGDITEGDQVRFADNVVTLDAALFYGKEADATNTRVVLNDSGNEVVMNINVAEDDDGKPTPSPTENSSGLIKAGDVITITLGEAVLTEPAATGKDAFRLQVGANASQEIKLGINSMRTQDLDIADKKTGEALDITTQAGASMAVEAYDMAIQKVSTERAKLGATQNRLEHTIANLDTSSENLQAAESSLRDTNMAEEMTVYSKSNILQQAGQSMLAQANQSTQGVLALLQ
ncbi:MAG: flagellin [Lachnospiraceae bacterium]|nr:flagellin [Lachnospiraceae bacterium]